MIPDFRDFRGLTTGSLMHSAKGSEWKKHKYIKRIDGTYYYPDDYEGGRHLPDGKGAEYKDYDEKDPDFADSNWDKAKRLGDTDFHYFQREDGTYVILEEDMKWVLPKGAKIDDDLIKRLEAFDESVSERRKSGDNKLDWQKEATAAINGGSSSVKLTENDVNNLAKEVIRGNFGNGQTRRDALGDSYAEVQAKVNEILKGSGSKKISEVSVDPSVHEQVKAALEGVKDNRVNTAVDAWNKATKKK